MPGAVSLRSSGGSPAPGGVWTLGWKGDLELYYNPEFCEVLPRLSGVIAGQTFKFGGLYLRPPGDHRLCGGGVG